MCCSVSQNSLPFADGFLAQVLNFSDLAHTIFPASFMAHMYRKKPILGHTVSPHHEAKSLSPHHLIGFVLSINLRLGFIQMRYQIARYIYNLCSYIHVYVIMAHSVSENYSIKAIFAHIELLSLCYLALSFYPSGSRTDPFVRWHGQGYFCNSYN